MRLTPGKTFLLSLASVAAAAYPRPAAAFFEDICLSKGRIAACIESSSACKLKPGANSVCPAQVLQSFKGVMIHPAGRSMIHADATYFLAQALGYRADVAYWITAYNEVTDLTNYAPLDQCGGQATPRNSGSGYITATFNGFQRTNAKTDGPLYHYVLPFSPNGDGTDVHGANGVQAVYPLHFPVSGYPDNIDDVYQGTLANLRQWAMQPGTGAGLLCAAGFTEKRGRSNFSGADCMRGVEARGTVPLLQNHAFGAKLDFKSGPKVLDNSRGVVTYEQLGAWLADSKRTTGTLWSDPAKPPVPVQVARIGLYLHTLQDTASHATFCGDDAPSPPGGSDVGSYMAMETDGIKLVFGAGCSTIPHIVGHVQETGTGTAPLPLRDYTALNATLQELIAFGNRVAKPNGWIVNPELLPPDVRDGRNGQGRSAADLASALVGTIVAGQEWTRGEVYRSGVVTLPLQAENPVDRVHAMNAALAGYSDAVRQKSADPAHFSPFAQMPGNSRDPNDRSVCFK